MSESFELICPAEFSDTNPENTACLKCGSRIHFMDFIDCVTRCSYCENIIGEAIEN
jgi:DNA-directed RNA polymerase subunit RPC12/RpoP